MLSWRATRRQVRGQSRGQAYLPSRAGGCGAGWRGGEGAGDGESAHDPTVSVHIITHFRHRNTLYYAPVLGKARQYKSKWTDKAR